MKRERERERNFFSPHVDSIRVDGRIRRGDRNLNLRRQSRVVEKIDRGEGTKGRNAQLTYYRDI